LLTKTCASLVNQPNFSLARRQAAQVVLERRIFAGHADSFNDHGMLQDLKSVGAIMCIFTRDIDRTLVAKWF